MTLQLYQYGDDFRIHGKLRSCASKGCPFVMVLRDQPDMFYDRDWQLYLVACNMPMKPNNIADILGPTKALTNSKGINEAANWIQGQRLNSKTLPRIDKCRTFGLNTHVGMDTYRVTYAIAHTIQAVLARSFMAAREAVMDFNSNNALVVLTFDGTKPPPMKPGRPRPTSYKEVNPDDFLILPSPETRHMFLDCTNEKRQGKGYKVGPWAHGAVYDWTGDNRPHTFVPLASKFEIVTPLKNWRPVSKFPSPFIP